MRRLNEWQEVSLLVGATQLRCRVVAVNSDEAALQPVVAPRVSRQELEGRASLIFGHKGMLVALKGRAKWGEQDDDLRFRVGDGVQLPQQRGASRLRIPLEVAVTVDGAAAPATARSIDLSATGLSLEGAGFGVPGDTLDLEIELPDREAPLRCRGKVVRATIQLTAVAFVDLDPASRNRISRFVFAVQRMLASGELATG
jgi:hypothetical protein